MKRSFWLLLFAVCSTHLLAQHQISARVLDADGSAVPYANVALYAAGDSALVKVEVTNDAGDFLLQGLAPQEYFLVVSYLGAPDLRVNDLELAGDRQLGDLTLSPAGVDLAQATVRTTRTLVEVKPDRTVFNVQGTINAAGNDGLDLLRKAPGVDIDNNDNISVLSRSGVLIYVDGRRVPLQGADLSNYLRTLTAEQIDRIDIITSPGARYEAQGNAGIIDIRLKRAEDEGANGSLTASGSQGRYAQYAVNLGGNYRNDRFNAFANLSYAHNQSFTESNFVSRQNNFLLVDDLLSVPTLRTPGVRAGLDIYLDQRQTLGVLVSGQFQNEIREVENSTEIFTLPVSNGGSFTGAPDSILRARVFDDGAHNQNTLNLNYNFAIAAGHNLNVDLDYGRFRNDNLIDQPNRYFSPAGQPLSVANNSFDTPVDIDIYTARMDYEFPLGKGAASAGAKFSRVATDNTFLFYEGLRDTDRQFIDARSNHFGYDEAVYAVYSSYGASLNERWAYSLGLRMEVTDASGALTAFAGSSAPPVDFNYVSLFPNVGLTHTLPSGNVWNLRYGRRINRPDYNSLNPFRVQLNELSYRRGNPFLQPEKINNVELGYVVGRRYNFKLAYSRTEDQVAQLLSPDSLDPRAGFETYDNLARQTVYNFTASSPVQLLPWWRSYLNATAGYLSNEADYGEGGVVNIEVFNYRFYSQNTFTLPGGFTGELTGQYVGPGVGGGTFEYNGFGVINLGLQRRFLQDQLIAKLTLSDVLYSSVIDGSSNFNGLYAEGRVVRDSRRAGLSLSYNFGNQKVQSRRRDTGLEAEASRVH